MGTAWTKGSSSCACIPAIVRLAAQDSELRCVGGHGRVGVQRRGVLVGRRPVLRALLVVGLDHARDAVRQQVASLPRVPQLALQRASRASWMSCEVLTASSVEALKCCCICSAAPISSVGLI